MEYIRNAGIEARSRVLLDKLSEIARAVNDVDLRSLNSASSDGDALGAGVSSAVSELEDGLKNVEAILKIAAAHTSQLTPTDDLMEYDLNALKILQVQINPRSSEDAVAADLFYAAFSQRNWLIREIDRQRAVEDDRREDLSRQKRMAYQERCQALEHLADRFEAVLRDARGNAGGAVSEKDFVDIGLVKPRLPMPEKNRAFFDRLLSERGIDPDFDDAANFELYGELDHGFALRVSRDRLQPEISNGLQSLVVSTIQFLADRSLLDDVVFVSPDRCSPLPLGKLGRLVVGESPAVRRFPRSEQSKKELFKALEYEVARYEESLVSGQRQEALCTLYLFLDYPYGYSEIERKVIDRLLEMSNRGRVVVLLHGFETLGETERKCLENEHFEHIPWIIECDNDNDPCLALSDGYSPFCWNDQDVNIQGAQNSLEKLKGSKVLDNRYASWIQKMRMVKGERALMHLPIGLDEDGGLIEVGFENELFAMFVAGASRSGKSTFLHTLLTGVFVTKHPDDVEVWLVDFKMTEFSRYTRNTPPHIRYIVLDESPELVYDLLDRLTDVLVKRQAIFKKNGWTKMSDIDSAVRYMPVILVVIDEFSVLSKIVADAAMLGRDYQDKLQMLLAKGAALGFRFVFASQGFTQGTKGLNDFSKKQIQQRVAMKTDYAEVKATLDIPSVSEQEREMMESLTPHYALVKNERMEYGCRLQKTHVLYFDGASQQQEYLKPIIESYKEVPGFEPGNREGYISKQLQIFDGNQLTAFSDVWEAILADTRLRMANSRDEETVYAFCGQPVRMHPYMPIHLSLARADNILVLASSQRKNALQSILATLCRTLVPQGVSVNLILPRSTSLVERSVADKIESLNVVFGPKQTKDFLNRLADKIDKLSNGNGESSSSSEEKICLSRSVTVAFDVESLLRNHSEKGDPLGKCTISRGGATELTTRPRKTDQVDFRSRIKMGQLKIEANTSIEARKERALPDRHDPAAAFARSLDWLALGGEHEKEERGCVAYDYDFAKLLEISPELGHHFVVVTNDFDVLKSEGILPGLFRHKIAFRTRQEVARTLFPRKEADLVVGLGGDCFRYFDGIDGVTFRPYSHEDLGILDDQDWDTDQYLL